MKGEKNWEYIDRMIRGKTDLNENKLQFIIYNTPHRHPHQTHTYTYIQTEKFFCT